MLPWYNANARSMPWREHHDPYWTWVSEIMLQQTRVEAATSYFLRFMEALPTIADLAAVPDDELMKLWEGLGYYSRARNLKRAAQIVCEQYGGALPADYGALLSLPGIGSYTAGAIASIAFGLPYPAVDGNVLRVVSRVTGCAADIAESAVKQAWETELTAILPAERIGDFTQSLMETGALVCLPNGAPQCSVCPLSKVCRAFLDGRTNELPVKAPKKARRIEEYTVFLLLANGRAALHKRPESGLLAGLWELPMHPGHIEAEMVSTWFKQHRISAKISKCKPAKHIFSHIEWRMQGYLVMLEAQLKTPELIWAARSELDSLYTLPSAFKAYRKLLEQLL
ncbi:MAG: A/G-specific adenine glycosylase [Oscillospiraceae bacterium]